MAGLNVKEFSADDEILLYLGCTANYDRRIQKVALALMQIFEAAGVRFGVLKDQGALLRRRGPHRRSHRLRR